jgi:hypothetical protein
MILVKHEDAFNRAYAECSLHKAERFSIYQGKEARSIADLKRAAKRLHERLAIDFSGHKNSDKVLVLPYDEDGYVNFIVYHEKRTRALLTFKPARKNESLLPLGAIRGPLERDLHVRTSSRRVVWERGQRPGKLSDPRPRNLISFH